MKNEIKNIKNRLITFFFDWIAPTVLAAVVAVMLYVILVAVMLLG